MRCARDMYLVTLQTIIECLKYITTGDMPPNSKGGAFVHDPNIAREREVKGQVKLRFKDIAKRQVTCSRSLQSTQKVSWRTIIIDNEKCYHRARFIWGLQFLQISQIFCFTQKLFHQKSNNSLWHIGVTRIYLKSNFHKIVLLPFSRNL